MALEGTVKLPAFGVVKKKTAVIGGLGAAAFVVVAYIYRSRQASAAAATTAASTGTTGAVTDPAGNTCAAVNPATGFCPGTAEDTAALAAATSPFDTSGLGGGGLSGYYYGSNTSGFPGDQQLPPGPGNFADNAEWAQYAESYLTSTVGADPGTVSAALGAYINGAEVTAAQQSIIEQAIAIAGQPPQPGASGDPPGINLGSGNPPPPNTGNVIVPDVVGQRRENAGPVIRQAGLVASFSAGSGTVTAESPAAGASVKSGSTVKLTLKPDTTGGGNPPPAPLVTVPNVVGQRAENARTTLRQAGLAYTETVTGKAAKGVSAIVTAQSPKSGTKAAKGSSVRLTEKYS